MRQITKQEKEIFGRDKNESHKFVSLWMKNFEQDGKYDSLIKED